MSNLYRMMVLLEEPMEEDITISDSKEEKKVMHEFMDELTLPFQIDEIDLLNKWFDKFDDEICIPNEGHIKYEITSDGLIVLILDKELGEEFVGKVKTFVEQNNVEDEDEDEEDA
ncbi:Protein of unknown function (DUF1892) [Nakaseomyces glabratus]|nr:Protein of unknown function (DUF1892) [Nakaseomyces glabratus]